MSTLTPNPAIQIGNAGTYVAAFGMALTLLTLSPAFADHTGMLAFRLGVSIAFIGMAMVAYMTAALTPQPVTWEERLPILLGRGMFALVALATVLICVECTFGTDQQVRGIFKTEQYSR